MSRRHGLGVRRPAQQRAARYRVHSWPFLPPSASRRLLAWFGQKGAAWPWRAAGVTPFGRLVAEMLLRQTGYLTVLGVWPALMERCPDPAAMAATDPGALEAMLRPLGLSRQRTRALQEVSRALLERHGGAVPAGREVLEALPHVGPYAAAAVCSFAFGIPEPIVDVNILRVFGRYFNRQPRTHNPHRERWIWRLVRRSVPEADVPSFNYALLDLAHQLCRLREPRCSECPLAAGCQWTQKRR